MTDLQYLETETRAAVALVRFNRPKVMNALCAGMMDELAEVIAELDADDSIRSIVLTGNDKAFAAGADISEMQDVDYQHMLSHGGLTRHCDMLANCDTPIVAAVAGYALGGGCELAMMCDFILAADTAKFGQPEINLGVMPGAGGSQRLTRFVGKSKSMEMCLTGRMMDADEAERSGLVSRVVPAAELLDEAMKTAGKIAEMSLPSVMMTKEAVNRAYETTLAEGVRFERRLFHSMFALEDQKEGMRAFIDKRKAQFKNK